MSELREFNETMFFLREIERELRRIAEAIEALRNPVFSFKIISPNGDNMNINPGQTTVLTAVPLDAAGNPTKLPAGDVPTWSASDTSQITATPSADGLSLTVVVNPAAPPSTIVFTLTDAIIPAATGTFSLTITPAGPNPVASFSITASTPTP